MFWEIEVMYKHSVKYHRRSFFNVGINFFTANQAPNKNVRFMPSIHKYLVIVNEYL